MPGTGRVPTRRRRRVVAALAVTAVVGAGTLGLVAATDARSSLGGAAAAFVPADGAIAWSAMPGGLAQHEQARSPGVAALFALPQSAAQLVIGSYPESAQSIPHWVTYSGPEAARAGGIPRDVYSLTSDGIRIVASSGFPTDSVFVPGLLVLPADVEAGAEWTSEGDSLWAGIGADGAAWSAQYAFTAESAARVPEDPALEAYAEDGCLESVSALTLAPAEGASLVYRQTSLWCPGAGQVATTGAFEGEAPLTIGPADAPEVEVQPGTRVPSWQHPESWDAAPVPARWSDPLWGDHAFTATPALAPVMVGELLAVADVNSGDLTLLRRDEQGLVVSRVLHPGGDVIALGAVGDVVVAATSKRGLVAYTSRGDRVWTVPTPDLVVAPPLSDGGDGLVVAGLDGTVRLLDLATGDERWVADVSRDGVATLAVASSLAVAGDRVGGVAAVDLADGSVVWTDESDDAVEAFATATDDVFVARGDRVERLDPDSGTSLWKTSVGTGIDDLVVAADQVVAQTWRDLAAIDPGDGAITWRAPAAAALASDGSRLIAAGGSSIRLISEEGTDAATWPVPPESLGSFRYLTAEANAVWLTDAKVGIVRVGP